MSQVTLHTNKGDILIQLHDDRCPETVAHFIELVKAGFYDGSIFHRVIPSFVIQGGGYQSGMAEIITNDAVANESANAMSNARGTVAMARKSNADARGQFFINLADNSKLDYQSDQQPGYCVFGEVISGMDVVDAIAAVETRRNGMLTDVPVEEIVINEVTL
ncbi:TPA: peptidylprolyl isomerase [Escherichia coli]|nr:peptidylprolyl isomerase [Escherichia coli]EJD4214358.1 peptidylprolyl isomerase [Escherichia coli]EKV5484743.1 peptidylprolyl isomerase [Escherichia coli]HBB7044602.1 peptidylprolyl isomerase [Escherichia coli]HDV2374290.1 peptidylprolyl isomerase [Escherichia coli]